MSNQLQLQVEWVVCCGRVIADQQTGELTLVDVIENVAAVQFPALHQRFAIAARLSTEAAPDADCALRYRVVRISDVEGERTILETEGRWAAGTTQGRFRANFAVLRLLRPERLRFRVDVAVDEGAWQMGCITSIHVVQMQLTAEQATRLEEEMAKLQEVAASPVDLSREDRVE